MPLTALLGEFLKGGRRLRARGGKKNGSRNCSIGSGSFRIQFNPGFIVKGRGWKRGEGDGERERERERGAKRERNKNKVKCFN